RVLTDDAFVAAAEDAGEQAIEHWMTGWWKGAKTGKGRKAPFPAGCDIVAWGPGPRLSSAQAFFFSPRNLRGLATRPFSHTSKCTWAPVLRPVLPARAICWPTRTRSPTCTTLAELWA